MTRFYTIKGRQNGFKGKGVLSVGRVQTPLLGLIVRRDETIDNFQPKPFYEVTVPLLHQSGEEIIVKWQPSEACEAYMDEEKRVLSKKLCEHVIERVSNNQAEVLVFTEKVVKKSPPLPYNLSSLQIDANRQFGMSAKAVLDTCQSLYEKYKMISYPRSDCRYLPEAHFADANNIRASIQKSCAPLSNAAQQMNPALKSKAWNDKKVGAHHAIIPTLKACDNLPKQEANVYRLVARQYLLQFYPELVQKEQRLVVEIDGGRFKANGLAILDLGFRKLFDDPDFGGKAKTQTDKVIPAVTKGEKLPSLEGTLLEKETQPPLPFTEATLLSAMTGIARFVKQMDIKKILKETDGLGTEATRAHIIELLIKRQFIKKSGKQVRSTALGKQLIASLPAYATEPDMTAQWESTLEKIAQKETSYQRFMLPLEESLTLQISRKSS
jgi:DNA topoisomerase-3